MTELDLYKIYSQKYDKNVAKIEKYSPSEAQWFKDNKMSREEFNGAYDDYRALLIEKQPRTRPSKSDVANWIANQETKEKSYKSTLKIMKASKELGYNFTLDRIQFGSPETDQELKEFWDEIDALRKGERTKMEYATLWGSP